MGPPKARAAGLVRTRPLAGAALLVRHKVARRWRRLATRETAVRPLWNASSSTFEVRYCALVGLTAVLNTVELEARMRFSIAIFTVAVL